MHIVGENDLNNILQSIKEERPSRAATFNILLEFLLSASNITMKEKDIGTSLLPDTSEANNPNDESYLKKLHAFLTQAYTAHQIEAKDDDKS